MAAVTQTQTVANSPLSGYSVGIFKASNGAELQAMVWVDSAGNEITSIPVIPAPEQLALKLDEASATITYVGEAATGTLGSAAAWRIKKIDETSGLVITWADGNADFDNVWDNRASLSYS